MSHATRHIATLALAALLGACSTVDKPVRPTMYDFGPSLPAAQAAQPQGLPPIVLPEVEATGGFDGSAVLYRLGYADAHQLLPYAHARWSAAPSQLIRQRLRDQLGQQRVVLNVGESAALARGGKAAPRVLRIEVEEFSHFFESPTQSFGMLRLRATLLDYTAGGERLVAQRGFEVRRPAPSADAAGGVRALTEATDAAAGEIGQWLQQSR
jgi:cholesterol transport system auxiliary component